MFSDNKNAEPDSENSLDPKSTTTMLGNDLRIIEEEKRKVVELTCASLENIQLNDHGWTSRVYIIDDGKIVFKFPRMEAVKKEYVQEIKIYKLLEQLHVHLQVPRLRWTDQDNNYFGYEGIVGTQFSSEIDHLNDEEKRQLGRDVGEFLKQLHQLHLSEPHIMTVEDEIKQAHEKYAGCIDTLRNHFNSEEIVRLDRFMHESMPLTMRRLGEDSALCHGDLGYWNMLLKVDGSLGVIDFGDIGYYDRSKDFCGLQDQVMLDATLKEYGDNKILREKIDIRQKYLPFFDLQYFAASRNEAEITNTLDKIRIALLS